MTEIIDKLGWLLIRDRKVLFVRSKGKDTFYVPGGKRELGETDEQALTREIKEELTVQLIPSTLRFQNTFKAQAHGKPEGTMVEIKYYQADFTGDLIPNAEIDEIDWLTSQDMHKTPIAGQIILNWLRQQDLIS